MITFLLSGLWHGASMNYIVWGGIHGLYQVVGDLLSTIRKKLIIFFNINTECFSYKLGQVVGTFLLTDLAWIFFRAKNIKTAVSYICRMVTEIDPWSLSNGTIYTLGLDRVEMNILSVSIAVLLLADLLQYYKKMSIAEFVMKQNVIFQYMVIVIGVMTIFIFGVYGPQFDSQAFIYFQF